MGVLLVTKPRITRMTRIWMHRFKEPPADAWRLAWISFDGARRRRLAVEVGRWLPALAFPWLVILFGSWLAPWMFMWAMLVAIVASAKWLTWSDCSPATRRKLCLSLGYAVAWPGLDARRFLGETRVAARAPSQAEWWQAIAKTLMGVGLMWGVARSVPSQWTLLRGWVGMVGLAFALHFGL